MASQEILLQRVQSAKVDSDARDTPHDGLRGKAEGGRMKTKAQNCKVPPGRVVHMQAACLQCGGNTNGKRGSDRAGSSQ